MGGGLMSTMVQGAAFGAGSEVGHQAVRSMMGGGSSGHSEPAQQEHQEQQADYSQGQAAAQEQQPQYENPCMTFNQSLLRCLQQNKGEITVCQQYMDMLNQCEADTKYSSNYQ